MKKIILIIIMNVFTMAVLAQTSADTAITGISTITKDERIDILGKKMAEYNESLASKIHTVNGYRLMLLSTTDREQAMQVRGRLLQDYPEQKVYMTFQSPYIKLKFGNFIEKEDAEKERKQLIAAKIVTGNIYIVPEMVEVKPEKTDKPVPAED